LVSSKEACCASASKSKLIGKGRTKVVWPARVTAKCSLSTRASMVAATLSRKSWAAIPEVAAAQDPFHDLVQSVARPKMWPFERELVFFRVNVVHDGDGSQRC